MKLYLRNKKGYIKLNKDSVKVVEDKRDATVVDISQLKDTECKIYALSPMIGRLFSEVLK